MNSIKLAAMLAIALFSFSAADAQVVNNKKDRARVKQGVKSGELTKQEVKEIRKIEKEKKQDIRNWKELYKVQSEFQLQSDLQQPVSNIETEAENTAAPIIDEVFQQQFLQIGGGYILTTTKTGILLIDQHLAHQRILYEQFENAVTQAISIQKCLIPQTIDLSAADAILLQSVPATIITSDWRGLARGAMPKRSKS